jgi:transcriptional regulator with XRE-family HTH domain
MSEERMALTQKERDRLDWLKQAQRKQITQREAAERMGVSERWVRKLLRRMKSEKDRVVVHKLRGRPSNRRRSAELRDRVVKLLSDPVYAGYGPTLAAERLQEKHCIRIGREALRQLMIQAGLWRARSRQPEAIHAWRPRRSQFGELVQWDSSTHDWLEGRGPQMKLIRLIDDATSRSLLRFVEHDSVEENFRLLERWLRNFGRMRCCYTDKAALFRTTEKRRRDRPGEEVPAREMPPTPCRNSESCTRWRIPRKPKGGWSAPLLPIRTGWSRTCARAACVLSNRPIAIWRRSTNLGGKPTAR